MILKSIKLHNIRSYISQEINFPEGSVLLSGDIGSGKSTILLAIEFALFGIKRGDLYASALLRHGTKQGSVELSFQIQKKDIIIKRTLKRTKTSIKADVGYIIINNKKTEATPVELRAKVLDILGYPKSLITKSKDLIYRYTVYTPQETMKQILLEDDELRLDTLRKVFDIDKYKRIRDNAAFINREMKNKKALYQGKIADLEQKTKEKEKRQNEIEETKKKLNQVLPEFKKAANALEKSKKNIEDIEKETKLLNDIKKQIDTEKLMQNNYNEIIEKNKKEIIALDRQIEELKKRIDEIGIEKIEDTGKIEEDIEKNEKDLQKIKEKKTQLKEKLMFSKKRVDELNMEIEEKSQLSKQMIEKRSKLELMKKDIEKKKEINLRIKNNENKLKELHEKISKAEIIITNSEKIKKKVTELDECPTCLQDVGKEHKTMIVKNQNEKIKKTHEAETIAKEEKKKHEELLQKAKKELEQVQKTENIMAALSADIKNLEKTADDIIKKQKILNIFYEDLNKLKEEDEKISEFNIKEMNEKIKQQKILLKKMIEVINLRKLLEEKSIASEKMVNQTLEIEKKIKESLKKQEELSKKAEKHKDVEERYDAEKKEFDKLLEEHRKIELKKVELERDKSNIQTIIKALDEEIKEKLEIKKKIANISQLNQWMSEVFINLMSVMEKNIMMRVYREFNELFTSWFNVLVSDEIINVRLDDTFRPTIEQNGYETEFENLSGGEKTAVALAYRLALNKVINDFVTEINTKNIIMLDEPTDGFSSEQLDKVREVLDELKLKQVIIVSHESKVESFVDNVIRINKEEHVSVVS